MKFNRRLIPASAILTVALTCLGTGHLLAQQTSTTVWTGGAGNWSDASWSAGVPTTGSLAGVLNGSTITVAAPAASDIGQILIDGSSVVVVASSIGVIGTDAIVNDPPPETPATGLYVNTGTLNVNSGGELTVTTGGNFRVGNGGNGALTLANGGVISTDRPFVLGSGAASVSTFDQTGGTFAQTGSNLLLGASDAMGTFSASGGTLTTAGAVTAGSSGTSTGILNISGTVDADLFRLFISGGATTTGKVNVSGGSLQVASELTVGPNAAATSIATLNINDEGDLETANLRIRNGTVNQSGESSLVTVPSGGGGFFVGIDTAGAATYNMSGGTLNSETRLRVGVNTTNSMLFNQTGGVVSITGRLDLAENGGPSNIYQISGGSLNTTDNCFVGAFTSGTATFSVSGTADVNLSANLVLGRDATIGIVNASGGTVNATTATIGENPLALSSLNVSGNAFLGLTGLRVRNGTVTQNGGSSLVDVTGDVIVGQSNTLNATYNMQAGTLFAVGRLRFGSNTGSRTNLFDQTGGAVSLKNRLDVGEVAGPTNLCRVSGGSIILSGGDQRILVPLDGSGTLEVSGTGLVEGSSVVVGEFAASVGTVNLNGGVVLTNQIKSGNAPASAGTLNLDGGIIRSRTSAAVNIDGNRPANLLAGGVTFDVPDAAWTTTTTGIMTGVGGLTKIGPGTLVVNGVQAYSGATRVNEGTLSLVQPYLNGTGDVYLVTGATLGLQFAGSNDIGTLFIDGVPQPTGTYSSVETPLISGTGSLNATVAGNLIEPTIVSITRSGTTATIVLEGAPSTEYQVFSSTNLISFSPIATTPATVVTNGSGDATFTVDATESRKFYRVAEAP